MSTMNENSAIRERASKVLPAGGFGNYDPGVFISHGKGSRVWDTEGREYIDFLIGSGPMLLGHGHPEVVKAIKTQLDRGMTFFANNQEGLQLAEEICTTVACADQLRYVSTGGEADMYAMRLARAFTGRDKIIKFEGGYHGMSGEALMSLAPKELKDFPQAVPDSAGIPEAVRANMLIAPFNDMDYAKELMQQHADDIACVIVEPLQRIVPPAPGFLEMLREETQKHGIVLIFDEVVTGFRLAYGGAQEYYGVTPDLCTLGKVIGGGLPLAAIAGRQEIMNHFDVGKVGKQNSTYQIGTLSGNPLAAVAGLKTMEVLKREGSYEQLRANGQAIMDTLAATLGKAGIAHQIVGDPVLFDVVFTKNNVKDYRDCLDANSETSRQFNKLLREQGILKADSKYYASLALDRKDIDQACYAIETAVEQLAQGL